MEMKNIGIFQSDTIPGHFTCNVFRENLSCVLQFDFVKIVYLNKKIKYSSIKLLNKTFITTKDKNSTTNKEWDTIRSQHAALCSLSVSKTLHVKRPKLVSIWKIPIFFISMSHKNYLRHMHE